MDGRSSEGDVYDSVFSFSSLVFFFFLVSDVAAQAIDRRGMKWGGGGERTCKTGRMPKNICSNMCVVC